MVSKGEGRLAKRQKIERRDRIVGMLLQELQAVHRINEIALEHHKNLINDQAEMVQKMGSSLDNMFPKLMARDQDVDKEFRSMEKRLNRHRVALDKAEDCIQALEDTLATQQAKMDSILDKLCLCRTRSVQSHSSSLV